MCEELSSNHSEAMATKKGDRLSFNGKRDETVAAMATVGARARDMGHIGRGWHTSACGSCRQCGRSRQRRLER